MDAELKAKWVKALRSGKYQQARGQLKDGDRYCCLGVLCDIAGRGEFETRDRLGDSFVYNGDRTQGTLPEQLSVEIELSPIAESTCWKMNDQRFLTFPEIADWIEENL
ncbi:hypothetical protein [Bradyrhizobium sp. Tv2a-2]|uniref:hypothetical protein n=1 Tax=Bradyrhizobium sp. Tv2a-2 TaxID=113395 RepID=UPI0003FCB752|nr:hypothetical protein [Bradyrhizobium sp. Tv2a-2]